MSDHDIRHYLRGHCKVVAYPDLAHYKTIDQAMGPSGCMALLYETKRSFGHWCAVFRSAPDTISIFDSYGKFFPDDELKMISPAFRNESGQNGRLLSNLIRNTPKYTKVVYNEKPLQKFKSGSDTCGRWTALRLALRHIPLEQFRAMFYGHRETPDWLVTSITNLGRNKLGAALRELRQGKRQMVDGFRKRQPR